MLAAVLAGQTDTNSVLGQELTPVEAQTIAREAYIYGYPIVESYRTMYAFAIDRDAS